MERLQRQVASGSQRARHSPLWGLCFRCELQQTRQVKCTVQPQPALGSVLQVKCARNEHSPLWGLCCDVPRGEVQFAVEVAVQIGVSCSRQGRHLNERRNQRSTARSGVCAVPRAKSTRAKSTRAKSTRAKSTRGEKNAACSDVAVSCVNKAGTSMKHNENPREKHSPLWGLCCEVPRAKSTRAKSTRAEQSTARSGCRCGGLSEVQMSRSQ